MKRFDSCLFSVLALLPPSLSLARTDAHSTLQVIFTKEQVEQIQVREVLLTVKTILLFFSSNPADLGRPSSPSASSKAPRRRQQRLELRKAHPGALVRLDPDLLEQVPRVFRVQVFRYGVPHLFEDRFLGRPGGEVGRQLLGRGGHVVGRHGRRRALGPERAELGLEVRDGRVGRGEALPDDLDREVGYVIHLPDDLGRDLGVGPRQRGAVLRERERGRAEVLLELGFLRGQGGELFLGEDGRVLLRGKVDLGLAEFLMFFLLGKRERGWASRVRVEVEVEGKENETKKTKLEPCR